MTACPRCGFQNIQFARYCQSCGNPLPQYPGPTPPPTTTPYYVQQPNRGSNDAIIIVAVVLIVILVLGIASAAYIFYAPFGISRTTIRPGPVQATNMLLVIQYPNSSSTYLGPAYRSLTYKGVPGPFYFQHGETFQTNCYLIMGGSSAHDIDSATMAFSGGFTLQSTTPTLPLTMMPGNSTDLTFTIQAPYYDYTGSVTIDIFTR